MYTLRMKTKIYNKQELSIGKKKRNIVTFGKFRKEMAKGIDTH